MLGMKIIYHQASLLNLIGNSMTTGLTSNRCHKKKEQKKKKRKETLEIKEFMLYLSNKYIEYLHTTQHKDIQKQTQTLIQTKSNAQTQAQPCTSSIFIVPQLFTRLKNFERSFVYCNILFQRSPVNKTTLLL